MKLLILIFFVLQSLSLDSFAVEKKDQENVILKNLRCLVCQGQSIADSNSDFAQTIKLVVKDQMSDGKSNEEIYEFLISKYGEWIVYKPRFNSNNFLLWSLPYFVFLFGGAIISLILKKRKNNDTY